MYYQASYYYAFRPSPWQFSSMQLFYRHIPFEHPYSFEAPHSACLHQL
jgi:hypothetical protein